jgi:predicted phosphodiesterase
VRIAILSDVHANLEALTAVLRDAVEEDCTQCYCLGDVVGYGPNPCECIELLRERNIACVQGNHDEACAHPEIAWPFNPDATKAIEWTRTQLSSYHRRWLLELPLVRVLPDLGTTLAHASLRTPNEWDYLEEPGVAEASLTVLTTGVGFFGHTHVAGLHVVQRGRVEFREFTSFVIQKRRKYLVNVGSVGQPRDGARAAYVVLDTDANSIGLIRTEYNFGETQRKIIERGLPYSLAERLGFGY